MGLPLPEILLLCLIAALAGARQIAQKIINKMAGYVLALEGNQGTLRERSNYLFAEQKAAGFKDTTISRDQMVDGDHGRIETRTTTVIHDFGMASHATQLADDRGDAVPPPPRSLFSGLLVAFFNTTSLYSVSVRKQAESLESVSGWGLKSLTRL